MKRLREPQWWLPIALMLLALLGGVLILQLPGALDLSQRDRAAYGVRPTWQAGFDALSAACGCGLLTYNLDDDYTELGRWLLVAIGVAGTILYLLAAWQLVRQRWPQASARWPSFGRIVGVFAGLHVACLVALLIAARQGLSALPAAAWDVVATGCSLGWLRHDAFGVPWLFAIWSVIAALGWPMWLLATNFGWRRRLLTTATTYPLFLVLAAALVCTFETPRGVPRGPAPPERPTIERFGQALTQTAMASGAGTETISLAEGDASEGTKLTLSLVVLAGGLGGSPGGGIKWTLLCVLAGTLLAWTFGRNKNTTDYPTTSYVRFAIVYVVSLAALAVGTALAMLLLDTLTGSPFQTPPTFADALLDASSAVGGANLSSGLTATLTSPNLSRGIRLGVDYYQYGMGGLMLAMLAGRILPIVIFSRIAKLSPSATTEPGLPPL